MKKITLQQIAELPDEEQRKLHIYTNRTNRKILNRMAIGRLRTELETENEREQNADCRRPEIE